MVAVPLSYRSTRQKEQARGQSREWSRAAPKTKRPTPNPAVPLMVVSYGSSQGLGGGIWTSADGEAPRKRLAPPLSWDVSSIVRVLTRLQSARRQRSI